MDLRASAGSSRGEPTERSHAFWAYHIIVIQARSVPRIALRRAYLSGKARINGVRRGLPSVSEVVEKAPSRIRLPDAAWLGAEGFDFLEFFFLDICKLRLTMARIGGTCISSPERCLSSSGRSPSHEPLSQQAPPGPSRAKHDPGRTKRPQRPVRVEQPVGGWAALSGLPHRGVEHLRLRRSRCRNQGLCT